MNIAKLFIALALLVGSMSVRADDLEKHETVIGAVFTRDERYPQLGAAFRDPSGLIWGETRRDVDGKVSLTIEVEAEAYCASINARLPTRSELEGLALNLGFASVFGYSVFTRDGKKEVLPALGKNYFWSDSTASVGVVWVLNGASGYMTWGPMRKIFAVRCVMNAGPYRD